MAKGWYILHTYSGYEGKIERTIRSMIENGDLSSDVVLDVKVPVEDVVVVRDGNGGLSLKNFCPAILWWSLSCLKSAGKTCVPLYGAYRG